MLQLQRNIAVSVKLLNLIWALCILCIRLSAKETRAKYCAYNTGMCVIHVVGPKIRTVQNALHDLSRTLAGILKVVNIRSLQCDIAMQKRHLQRSCEIRYFSPGTYVNVFDEFCKVFEGPAATSRPTSQAGQLRGQIWNLKTIRLAIAGSGGVSSHSSCFFQVEELSAFDKFGVSRCCDCFQYPPAFFCRTRSFLSQKGIRGKPLARLFRKNSREIA